MNAEPVESWLEGREFGPWRVEAFLAEGGMARIWRVRNVRSGAVGALKVSRSRDPELLARVAREGRIQSALRHANVLGALDIVDVDATPGLVLELVEGGLTLEHELQRGPLVGEVLDRAVHGVLDGVEAAHRAGFIHRDLKPANVLLAACEGGWVPRVADFGLARPEFEPPDAKMTRAGFILGSAAYMAPEQARDAGSVDARADIWSLGVMIYEMVGGAPPFDGATVEEVLTNVSRARFRPLDSVLPTVAARWQVAVEACLHVDPQMRAPDVATLRAIVRGERGWVSEGGGAKRRSIPGVAAHFRGARRASATFVSEPPGPPPATARSRWSPVVLVGGGAVVTLAGVALAAWFATHG